MNKTIHIDGREELLSLMDSFQREKHNRLLQKLSMIETQLKAVSSIYEHADDKIEDICLLFGLVKEELEQHMMKEENLFFPLVRKALENGRLESEEDMLLLAKPLKDILNEQKRIGVHFAGIRKISNDYKSHVDDAPTLKSSLHELMELEKSLELYFEVERRELMEKANDLFRQLNIHV
jgi:regulator of cell morphogenesis and NO signaling